MINHLKFTLNRWLAKDTITEELLEALERHPNAPWLDLQQCSYIGYQNDPPFARIASIPKLKALRIFFGMRSHKESYLSALVKGLFEVINAHVHQIEELELHIQLPWYPNLYDSPAGWNLLAGTGLSTSIMQEVQQTGGVFSALRSLTIISDGELFNIDGGQSEGLLCLGYYAYPVLQELNLEGTKTAWFMDQLTTQHTQLERLYINNFDEHPQDDLAKMHYLKSYSGLRSYSIDMVGCLAKDSRPLVSILKEHGETLRSLRFLSHSDWVSLKEKYSSSVFDVVNSLRGALPHLQHLEVPFDACCDPTDLLHLTTTFDLRVLGLYVRDSEENRISSRDHLIRAAEKLYFRDYPLDRSSHPTRLQEILVYSWDDFDFSPSWQHIKPVYTITKDPLTNEIIWHDHKQDAQNARMRRFAKELGEPLLQTDSQELRDQEEKRLKLALFPAYRDAIDGWETG